MNHQSLKKVKLKIHGMHCASCEVLVERKFRKVPGVERVHVNHGTGKAEVLYSKEPNLYELDSLIRPHGYSVSSWHEQHKAPETHQNTKRDYLEIGAIFLIIVGAYYILRQLDVLPSMGVSENMSYGLVFLIGLVAALSTCIAVVGGLLLAVAAKYNEKHPTLNGVRKFKPYMYFNAGRVIGYTVFGGAIGALGSVISLSARVNGYLMVIVSFVMILLGFQLLYLFPALRRFSPKMPKFLAHRIHNMSDADNKSAPFTLGALTFFLPCGFTQALQLYVLSQGDWKVGALTMLVFSLGTLPALVSLSAISSFAKGGFQRHFLKFAGVLVIMLGVFNINNGLILAGSNFDLGDITSAFNSGNSQESGANKASAQIIDGKQIVRMTVKGYTYTPNKFTVVEGVPVEWQIDGRDAAGCGQVIVMPTTGLTKYLSPDEMTTITFTPTKTGEIPFNCSMGMMTRSSSFTVVPNTTGIIGATSDASLTNASTTCDPKIATCTPGQQVKVEVTNERGFYPNEFTVKKNEPVDITIDSKVKIGGCMSVMVIPDYNVTLALKQGKNKVRFTPTEEGKLYAACSMGIPMFQINVTS